MACWMRARCCAKESQHNINEFNNVNNDKCNIHATVGKIGEILIEIAEIAAKYR